MMFSVLSLARKCEQKSSGDTSGNALSAESRRRRMERGKARYITVNQGKADPSQDRG